MKLKKKLVKQFMLLLRNLDGEEFKLNDIEPIYRDGTVAGYRFRIETREKPKLKIVKNEKD